MVSFRWTVKGLSHRTTRIRSPHSPSHARCVAPAAAAPALRPRPPGREREAGGREMAVNPAGPTPYHLLPAPQRQEVADGPRGVPCAPWRRARDLTCREPTRDIPLVTKVMRKQMSHGCIPAGGGEHAVTRWATPVEGRALGKAYSSH